MAAPKPAQVLQCVAFSPYVGQLTPDYGAHPDHQLIDNLLDRLVAETPFRCIMTYGVLNGLEYTFTAAKARGIKVIAILWLDDDITVNTQSISHGIYLARTFKDTIIKISCGSEVRTRHNFELDSEITRCIQAMREAKISQPVTTIDTWWEWCNRATRCEPTLFSKQVDWIGINVFPWWENRFSPLHPCTPADKAADFHLARLKEVEAANPGKEVIITEFGWPSGPDNSIATNDKTGDRCGVAGPNNQAKVIRSTLQKLAEERRSGIVFEAFSEPWKPNDEGLTGRFWGLCSGEAPYLCNPAIFQK